ncbi:hypothetical protein AG1IA_06541 [Rhizoctonia solani AG-1 IA]|uniref:Uncharacterized protein n=1 Tax=Thanatephorus cucumeris (strain AG1-IA) TaxID=983506 RepID=L8WSR1_THACA|nr:hypothetical protein AG1IA_06541 [Rhizoctonia solani AG-1 IA]
MAGTGLVVLGAGWTGNVRVGSGRLGAVASSAGSISAVGVGVGARDVDVLEGEPGSWGNETRITT